MNSLADREAEEHVKTSSEQDVDGELPLGGPDIFLSARATRRVLMPRSLRRGRSRANDARRAAARANHPCQSGGLHIVDLDGESETARIALRRRFEETAATSTTPAAGESAAG
jgi:hypothetical protein